VVERKVLFFLGYFLFLARVFLGVFRVLACFGVWILQLW